jgi:hypothetical protein
MQPTNQNMKNLLLLIFSLLITINFKGTQPDTTEYIEFVNIGEQAKYIPPMFISKRKLDIKLVEPELGIFKDFQRSYPNMTKEEFIKLNFDLLITDENTYSVLLSFITTHKGFYSHYPYKLYPEGKLDIIANGEKFNLCYKTQKNFFSELIDSLKERNCDEKVVIRLGHIH